jgi:hypothetical protein
MKECFVITSYCDTEEKVAVLENTIDNLKQYKLDIIVHAHYPLNSNVQKKANYYLYSINPMATRYNLHWANYKNHKFEIMMYEWSHAVIKQWKESILFLESNYDVIHFVNYDVNITPELYSITKKYLDKSTFYQNFLHLGDILMVFFTIVKSDFKRFIDIFDIQNFFNFPYQTYLPTAEQYVKSFLDEKFNIVPIDEWKDYVNDLLKNEINFTLNTKMDWEKYKKNINLGIYSMFNIDCCDIFIGKNNDNTGILLYNIKKQLKIDIVINYNQKLNFNINTSDIFIDIPILFTDIKNLEIFIDDKKIEDRFVEYFFKYNCKFIK